MKRIALHTAAVVSLTAATVAVPATAQADPNCPSLYLCIWDGFNYNDHKQQWTRCTFVNIGSLGWSDRLRSFKNNQSRGTVTKFYNWNATTRQWEFLDQSIAPEFIPVVNFPLRTTDAIQVC